MGLFSSGTKTTKNPFESNPWEPQQDYLKDGFASAKGALDNSMTNDYTADMTSGQTSDLNSMSSWGRDFASSTSRAALEAGSNGISGVTNFGNNANDIYNRAGAGDPGLQGRIDSVMGDVRKGFDQDVSGINSAASGSGNINSTRAGVMEGMARDDAMDRGAMISANMRSEAHNTGISQQLNANGQVGQAAGQSLDFAKSGYEMGRSGYGDSLTAGDRFQGQNQAEIDGKGKGLDLVSRYMNTVGGSYGQNGYQSQTTESPSIFQQLVGGVAAVASF